MNIDEIRAKAIQEIDIPGFTNGEILKIKVQKPRILALAAQGKIPNALMGVAQQMARGKAVPEQADITQIAQMMELFCQVCMVEPTYDELKDIITDDQLLAIFSWATGDVQQLSTFRTVQENGAGNHDGQRIPSKAKSDAGDK